MAREGSFFVRGAVRRESGKDEISVHWSAGRPRQFARNGDRATFSEAGEALPAMLPRARGPGALPGVAVGPPPVPGPDDDHALSGRDRDHDRFQRALAQRNALLASPHPGGAELDTWTEEFIGCAREVARGAGRPCPSGRRNSRRAGVGRRTLRPRGDPARRGPVPGIPAAGAAVAARERGAGTRSSARSGTTWNSSAAENVSVRWHRPGNRCAPRSSCGSPKEGDGRGDAGAVPLYALDDFDAELSPAAARVAARGPACRSADRADERAPGCGGPVSAASGGDFRGERRNRAAARGERKLAKDRVRT